VIGQALAKKEGRCMRSILTQLVLALVVVATLFGCNHTPIIGDRQPPQLPPNTKVPEAPALVNYLNQQAAKVQTVRARVDMDCKAEGQSIALGGMMGCAKPRDFRLKANVLGQPAVDIGSNTNEFWYWISKAPQPYVYHCSYSDLSTGRVRIPFPFQPDMVVAALGMAEYDLKGTYEVRPSPRTLELIQDTVSPTGQPVKKIIVFNRMLSAPGQPQVLAHVLRDSKGGLICQAHVQRVQVDRTTGATVPTRVLLEWPAQKITMKLDLSDVTVNTIDRTTAGRMFSRADLTYATFDLGRGGVDSPTGLQRAGAIVPRGRSR
jgi:hypothetical protein